jgi:hypothetical protein
MPLATALCENFPAENTQRQLSRSKPTGVVRPTEIIIIIIVSWQHVSFIQNHLLANFNHGEVHSVCTCSSGIESQWAGEILRTRPHRPWSPPNLLHNRYRVSFLGVKRPGRGVDHTPQSSAEVKERVELYLYSAPGPCWPVLGWALPLSICRLNEIAG